MFFLQSSSSVSNIVFLGTMGMLSLSIGLVIFILFYQRKILQQQKAAAREKIETQKKILKATLLMQEQERQRIAADLHDDAGPLLSTAKLYLTDNLVNLNKEELKESIEGIRSLINDAYQLIRNLSHELMPPNLKNFGFEQGLKDAFEKINKAGDVTTICVFKEYNKEFDEQAESSIFRVVQELLNNILKHSAPTFIQFEQSIVNDQFNIELRHDGQGMLQTDFNELKAKSKGLGLNNIQNRIDTLQGKIKFEKDAKNEDFVILITIPFE